MRIYVLNSVVLLALWSVCVCASPVHFVGGDFQQSSPHFAGGFAIYGDEKTGAGAGWQTPARALDLPIRPFYLDLEEDLHELGRLPSWSGISDITAVAGGVLAVGEFTSIGGVYTKNVAFFDGQQWVGIRHGLDGPGRCVRCVPGTTDCFVFGAFSQIANAAGKADHFAHFKLEDGTTNHWVWVNDVAWSVNGSRTWTDLHPELEVVPGSMEITTYGEEVQFWVQSANGQIYRGGRKDDGWVHFSIALGAAVHDYDIFGETLYVALGAPDTLLGAAQVSTLLSDTPALLLWRSLVEDTNWVHPESLPISFERIAVVNHTTRYLAGTYKSSIYSPLHMRVFVQTDERAPQPLGDPFGPDYVLLNTMGEHSAVNYLEVGPDGECLIFGGFYGANWILPTWDDINDRRGFNLGGDPRASRPCDNVFFSARWDDELGRWVQPFGGGFSDPFDAYAYDAENDRWYFVGPFSHVYDLHGEAVWWDHDPELREPNRPNPWHPLFYRRLWSRAPRLQGVSEIPEFFTLADPADHGYVNDILVPDWAVVNDTLGAIVGGAFDGEGPNTYGAVFATVVTDDPAAAHTVSVGSGLWVIDYGVEWGGWTPDSDREIFLRAGVVNTLASGRVGVTPLSVYAGGAFSRTGSGNCVHNLARIDSIYGEWQSVGGGCDGPIHDLLILEDHRLYVTGTFRTCGGVTVNNIASFVTLPDGSYEWAPLNTGLETTMRVISQITLLLDDRSYGGFSMIPYVEGLVVAGAFQEAGGVITGPIAYWHTETQRWSALRSPCGAGCPNSGVRPTVSCPDCCPENPVFDIPSTAIVSALTGQGRNIYVLYSDQFDSYQAMSLGGPSIFGSLTSVLAKWDGERWIRITPQISSLHTDIWMRGSLFLNHTAPSLLHIGNGNSAPLSWKLFVGALGSPIGSKYLTDLFTDNHLTAKTLYSPRQLYATWDSVQTNQVDSHFGFGSPNIMFSNPQFAEDETGDSFNLIELGLFPRGVTVVTGITADASSLVSPLRVLIDFVLNWF